MVEIVTELQSRGQFDDPRKIAKLLPYNANLFRSYYIYDEIALLFGTDKSFTDYSGPYSLDSIVIDVDGHSNEQGLTLARDKCKGMVNWLLSKDVEEDNFLVWFSGGGFHLHIAASLFEFTPSNSLPETVRDTMIQLFPEGDNIYYPRSIIRVGYSYNEKRKLWKVPLHLHELDYGIDQIREIASTGNIRTGIRYDLDCFDPVLASFVVQADQKYIQRKVEIQKTEELSNVVTCMHKLYARGPVEKRRHTDMLRLASWMRRSHMPRQVIVNSLVTWAPDIPEQEIFKLVDDTFTRDYRYGCNDPVRLEFCDAKCIYYEQKNEGSEVKTVDEMNQEMIQAALDGSMDKYIDLQTVIGKPYRIYPGEFVAVTGDTGTNKSTFVQLISVVNPDSKILYVTTEVDRRMMYRRFLQMVSRMDKHQIMQVFRSGNKVPGSDKLSHIRIVDNMPSWDRLVYTIAEYDPHIIILDVMEDIGKGDSMDIIEHNARACKALAMQMRKIVIAVAHMRKAQGFSTRRKSNDDMKGPGVLKQKADKIIIIEGDITQYKRTISSGKARDESPFVSYMMFDPETFNLELL